MEVGTLEWYGAKIGRPLFTGQTSLTVLNPVRNLKEVMRIPSRANFQRGIRYDAVAVAEYEGKMKEVPVNISDEPLKKPLTKGVGQFPSTQRI